MMTDFEIMEALISYLPSYDVVEMIEINRPDGYIILVYDRDIDDDDPNDPAHALPKQIDGLDLLLA